MLTADSLPARLLVVAAHADDDTIGCGGTLAMTAAGGGEVHVAYLTDGSRSHPGSRAFPPDALAAMREAEARDALSELGIATEPRFFRLRDSALDSLDERTASATVLQLAAFIRSFEPELVLAPWQRDPHPDHVVAAELAHRAVAASGMHARRAGYDVWLSIRGEAHHHPGESEASIATVVLDAEARSAKRRALFAHRSQVSDLIHDDPNGFRISAELIERWLAPTERFFFPRNETAESC